MEVVVAGTAVVVTALPVDTAPVSRRYTGHPKKVWMDVQKMIVKTQNAEIEAVLKYHFRDDSFNTQKVRPPKANNKIGNAIFISLKF